MNVKITSIIEDMRGQLVEYDEQLQPPATGEQIAALTERAGSELGAELPPEYLDLLRVVNGILWENLYFYSTELTASANDPEYMIAGFIDANLENREEMDVFKGWLVFGYSGNMDTYIQDLETGKFQILDQISLSPTKSFDTFDELMESLLEYNL